MKTLLVTTGTTGFDELVSAVDSKVSDYQKIFQIGPGKRPKTGISFRFCDDFRELLKSVDIVITHAGAGSTYLLLELNMKMIVCPNLYRGDKHQEDICKWLENKRYAKVCWDIDNISEAIRSMQNVKLERYSKDDFKFDEISRVWIRKARSNQ